MFFTLNYADFKLVAAQFTTGKVFFFDGITFFRIWGMASGFPVLACYLPTAKPGTFAADFPSAVQLANPLQIEMNSMS